MSLPRFAQAIYVIEPGDVLLKLSDTFIASVKLSGLFHFYAKISYKSISMLKFKGNFFQRTTNLLINCVRWTATILNKGVY